MHHTRPLLAALVCSLTGFATAQPPPVEAYGRLPAIGSAAISPDGKHIALSVGFEYKASEPEREFTAFRIINLDTGAIEQTLPSPPGNTLRSVGWADDTRAYYSISAAADPKDLAPKGYTGSFRGKRIELFRTGVFSLQTKTPVQLMQSADFRYTLSLTNLQVPIEGDPGYGRMVTYGGASMNGEARLGVYRVNLDDGSSSPVADANLRTRGFMLDEKGAVVARVDINEGSNRWQLYTYENGKDRMILEDVSEAGMPLRIYGQYEDGRIAAINQHEGGSRDTLLAIDPQTGKFTEKFKTPGGDVWPLGDQWRHRAVGAGWSEDLPKQMYFDPQLQQIYDEVQQYFTGGYVQIHNWSRDRSRLVLFGERPGDAGAYYVYDRGAKKIRILGKLYPALNSTESMGERRAIKYKARDGKEIPAYLTLPAGVEAKKLPLVLLVHGGPHARDYFTFDWWASFLASRGYAVLQPNYRGSTGYGYEWFNAGRGGWGDGVMQTDVEDGVTALVKDGIADGARVCIMGGSYGGYAAFTGATLTPDRYACAVSVNGLSDPERYLNDASSGEWGKRGMDAEWWRKSMGPDDHLHRISPLVNADKARIPILIMHAVDDSVVTVEQSRNMYAKLKRTDKNVRYVEVKGDDHWLSGAATRTQVLAEIEKFLAEKLKSVAP